MSGALHLSEKFQYQSSNLQLKTSCYHKCSPAGLFPWFDVTLSELLPGFNILDGSACFESGASIGLVATAVGGWGSGALSNPWLKPGAILIQPFQGFLGRDRGFLPRASPWAIIFRPFRSFRWQSMDGISSR